MKEVKVKDSVSPIREASDTYEAQFRGRVTSPIRYVTGQHSRLGKIAFSLAFNKTVVYTVRRRIVPKMQFAVFWPSSAIREGAVARQISLM